MYTYMCLYTYLFAAYVWTPGFQLHRVQYLHSHTMYIYMDEEFENITSADNLCTCVAAMAGLKHEAQSHYCQVYKYVQPQKCCCLFMLCVEWFCMCCEEPQSGYPTTTWNINHSIHVSASVSTTPLPTTCTVSNILHNLHACTGSCNRRICPPRESYILSVQQFHHQYLATRLWASYM